MIKITGGQLGQFGGQGNRRHVGGLKEGIVELKWRDEESARKVSIEEAVTVVASEVREKASS